MSNTVKNKEKMQEEEKKGGKELKNQESDWVLCQKPEGKKEKIKMNNKGE